MMNMKECLAVQKRYLKDLIYIIELLFYHLKIWVFLLKKHTILRFGCQGKKSLEKSLAVQIVVISNQEG